MRLAGSGAVAALAAALLPAAAVGQSVQGLADACTTAGGDAARCSAAAVAGRAVLDHLGALSGAGSEIPGQASALGRRLGGTPRFAPWIGLGALRLTSPDLDDAAGAASTTSTTLALHAGLGAGLFDGFQLMPTMGGFLSMDVVGHARFAFLPAGSGFDGRVDVLSVGLRLGLLRESFTLPGVSASLTRRFSGDVRQGDRAGGGASEVETDPAITSLRLTVGKDLYAFGIMGGVGWDDYSSDVSLTTSGGSGAVTTTGTFDGSRRIYFVGLTMQIAVISWISLEMGWADGFEAPTGYAGSAWDPSGGSIFGTAALLLRL